MPDIDRGLVFTGAHENRLVADAWGRPTDPPVIFLHGGGQTRHAWGGSAERLAKSGWYTLTVDLRGHGDSDWTQSYERHDFGGDIIAIAEQLISKERPMLVGASLGGISALFAEELARGSEEEVGGTLASSLVLVDIAPRTNPEGVKRIVDFMQSGADGFATIDAAADAVAGYLRERARPKDTSGLAKNLRLKDDGRYYWHWDPRFLERTAEDRERDNAGMEAAARRLDIPVMLVRGGSSDVLTQEGIDAFKELVPHAEVVDIKGAGHMVAGDKNDAFTAAIVEFAAGFSH